MSYTKELYLGKIFIELENRLASDNLNIEQREKLNNKKQKYLIEYTQEEYDNIIDYEMNIRDNKKSNTIEREILDNEINCF